MIFKDVLTLDSGKKLLIKFCEVLFIQNKTFTADEDIEVEADKWALLHCPSIDGELRPDGEVYIL